MHRGSRLLGSVVRFSQTLLAEELDCSIMITVLWQQDAAKRSTRMLSLLTFRHKRTSLQKMSENWWKFRVVKLFHTLQQTVHGIESHLHTKMKPSGQWAWRKKTAGGMLRGIKRMGLITSGEREGDFFSFVGE